MVLFVHKYVRDGLIVGNAYVFVENLRIHSMMFSLGNVLEAGDSKKSLN